MSDDFSSIQPGAEVWALWKKHKLLENEMIIHHIESDKNSPAHLEKYAKTLKLISEEFLNK